MLNLTEKDHTIKLFRTKSKCSRDSNWIFRVLGLRGEDMKLDNGEAVDMRAVFSDAV